VPTTSYLSTEKAPNRWETGIRSFDEIEKILKGIEKERTKLTRWRRTFQGCALPTELPRHADLSRGWIRGIRRLESPTTFRESTLALQRLRHGPLAGARRAKHNDLRILARWLIRLPHLLYRSYRIVQHLSANRLTVLIRLASPGRSSFDSCEKCDHSVRPGYTPFIVAVFLIPI
jgi:hypothetical protein